MNQNYNFLQNNAFTFVLSRIPETMFRIVECSLPAISIPSATQDTPAYLQPWPGSALSFEDFTCRFIVDEDLKNYEEIYNWITQQRFCSDFKPTRDLERNLTSDGTLITMTNASTPNRAFLFKDMFPVNLDSIDFDTTVDAPQPVVCQVTFKFSHFVLKPLTDL